MTKNVFFLMACFAVGTISAQVDSLNMSFLGKYTYQYNLNDVWGYADSSGNEYALVGAENGFSVVDVTIPTSPSQKIFINGAFSLWRDIKSWSHYAYVSHDYQFAWSQLPNEGILIVDLDSLQNSHSRIFRPKFTLPSGVEDSLQTSHNIFIDENGVLYIFGASGTGGVPLFNGGALMYDLTTDPWNPTYLGRFDNFYLHDGYVRGDTLYGGAINNGFLAIINVAVKSSPQVLATKVTPTQFAHNCWLSDDGKTVFTTDEKPNAYIAAYDVSDLTNITEIDKIKTLPGSGVIPHNVHVKGDFLVTSYYTRGAHIVDAQYPDILIEVGYYDTSPLYSGIGYNGAWGAYPYLPSGNILISDMEEGLHVLTAEYKRGCRIHGTVKDSVTKNPILQADVSLTNTFFSTKSSVNGTFKMGFEEARWDTLVVSKFGYHTQKVPVEFVSGNYDSVSIALLPLSFGIEESSEAAISLYPNPSKAGFTIQLNPNSAGQRVEISILDLAGRLVEYFEKETQDEIVIQHHLPKGMYLVNVKVGSHSSTLKMLVD